MYKVAVYGTLRKGGTNHYLLQNATYLGQDQIAGYGMYDLGAYPFVKINHVLIEVYEVDKQTLDALDFLEGYPQMYDRIPTLTKYGMAYMYIMHNNPTNDAEFIPSGDWIMHKYMKTYPEPQQAA